MPFFRSLGLVLSLCLGLQAWASAQVQKIGHVNADSIIRLLPQYERAQSELEAYQMSLSQRLQDEEAKLKTSFQQLQQQAPNLAPVQLQKKQAELGKMQEDLQKMVQTAEADFAAKEAELMRLVFDVFEKALHSLAKEGGYAYIFDQKALLFHLKGDDLNPKLLKKLGL